MFFLPLTKLWWLWFAFLLSYTLFNAGSVMGGKRLVGGMDPRIKRLSMLGIESKKHHHLDKASICFSAGLQLLEGVEGHHTQTIRRQLIVSLAQCELEQGDFYSVVHHCTELLDEFPMPFPLSPQQFLSLPSTEQRQIKLAFQCRASALEKLGLPHIAKYDTEVAQQTFQPDRHHIASLDRSSDDLQQSVKEMEEEFQSIVDFSNSVIHPISLTNVQIDRLLNPPTNDKTPRFVDAQQVKRSSKAAGLMSMLRDRRQLHAMKPFLEQVSGMDSGALSKIFDMWFAILCAYDNISFVLVMLKKFGSAIVCVLWVLFVAFTLQFQQAK